MKTPKKIVIQSFKDIKPIFHKSYADVDAILNNIKREKRLENAKKDFTEAIDLHLISQNYKPARDNKGRFTKVTKKTYWYKVFDKAMYAVACSSIAFLIIYTLFS